MEAFVVGDVTGEIVRLTRTWEQVQQGEIKIWRRRHFPGPIALALIGIVTAIASTPRQGGGSSTGPLIGLLGLAAGVVWLIVNAFRAGAMLSRAQQAREVETGRLLQVARTAATATDLEPGPVDPDDARAPVVDAAVVGAAAVEEEPAPRRTVEEEEAARENAREQRRAVGSPPPPGQPFGVSQGGAEYLVATWMRHLGESDAGTSHEAGVGLVAAASARCVAQVKNDAAPVGVEDVQGLVAAAVDGRRPLFFTAGTYAEDAEALADQAHVALFIYDAVAGTLDGANGLGRTAMLDGLG